MKSFHINCIVRMPFLLTNFLMPSLFITQIVKYRRVAIVRALKIVNYTRAVSGFIELTFFETLKGVLLCRVDTNRFSAIIKSEH